MRRLIAGTALAASLCAVPTVAAAQSTPDPPTVVATSLVKRQVEVPVTTVVELATKSDVDSDKTGLWGLVGLLGLAGLAGLAARRRRDDTPAPPVADATPVRGVAPPKAEGATGHNP